MITEIHVTLPGWLKNRLVGSTTLRSLEDRMALVIDLAHENTVRGTGGPFGAAIFDGSGSLVSAGVNLVESSNCSLLHAEILAIMFAQKAVGRYDLSDGAKLAFELVASTEPCSMCYGAIPWSGVSRLVCGARDADARAIGFDEGPKMADWQESLVQRGILVVRDVLRHRAMDVLQKFRDAGGTVYNAQRAP